LPQEIWMAKKAPKEKGAAAKKSGVRRDLISTTI
jgi:hypothetical protein